MRVLFLDIDGVLNGHEKHPDSPYTTIRPDCVKRLNRIVKATDCRIVVSSAWRYMLFHRGGKPRPMSLLGFQYMLHTHGLIHCTKVIIGHTRKDEDIPERGAQIRAWLEVHPEVTSFVVLDDDPMAMELGPLWRRLVRTNEKMGLTDADARRAIAVLSRPWRRRGRAQRERSA